MATFIEMPKLSDTMKEGVLHSWLKKEGDAIEPGMALAEVESDKANMEMEAYESGTLRAILVKAGETVKIGTPIAIIGEADEDISALLNKAKGGVAAAPAAAAKANGAVPAAAAVAAPAGALVARGEGERVLASPLAKKIAASMGLDIASIAGSGPHGRVIRADVEKAQSAGTAAPVAVAAAAPAAAAPAAKAAPKGPEPKKALIGGGALGGKLEPATKIDFADQKLSTMRGVIARRLLESKTTIPHFYVSMDVAMEKAEEMRGQLKDLGYKVSVNDLVVKAAALALTKYPGVNASFQGDTIRQYAHIDIGVAVSIDDGLLVPVVRRANLKGLQAINEEVRDLATRARSRKLSPEEFTGATFSISNLGMYGVAEFGAIVNPPEAAILAVGGVLDQPVVRNGQVVPGRIMRLTLSADHRVIDGALAAEFLREVKTNLENPLTLAL